MVWGTGAARRHALSPDPDTALFGGRGQRIETPVPLSAQCAKCERWICLAGSRLPRDWAEIEGQALCLDCAPKTARARAATGWPSPRAMVLAVPTKSIGASAQSARYRGCRIGHDVALGLVALQIRAGASEPSGRDEVVQFLLDGCGLDQLIIELGVIRAELTAAQLPGTRAYEQSGQACCKETVNG